MPATAPGADTVTVRVTATERVEIRGQLDAFGSDEVGAQIDALVDQWPRLVVDISGLELLSAGGLSMLERSHGYATSHGRELRVVVTAGSLLDQLVTAFGRLPGTDVDRVPPRARRRS